MIRSQMGHLGFSLFVLVAFAWATHANPEPKTPTLTIYCAAALKPVIERASSEYFKKHAVRVEAQFGASGTLLSNIEMTKLGDLYLPADDSFLSLAKKKHLIAQTLSLAQMTPVIIVPKENPLQITSLDRLCKDGVRLAFANPDTASIGKVTRAVWQGTGDWSRVERRIFVMLPTVTDVANAVKLKTVDAGVVWDAVARQYPEMTSVHVPALDRARQRVGIGVLSTSKHPQQAAGFARYLASPDGQAILRELGYATVRR